MSNKLVIYTDGGARGNPGPAAIGVVIQDSQGKTIKEVGRYLGEATNNQAEYQAVIVALEEAKKLQADQIDFYLDSELVVKQLNRHYKIKDKILGSLFIKVWNLKSQFRQVNFFHIPREQNKKADAIVNKVLDQYNLK